MYIYLTAEMIMKVKTEMISINTEVREVECLDHLTGNLSGNRPSGVRICTVQQVMLL